MKKVFRTLDEQVNILKDRGLIIFDLEKAKKILLKENYFFISGYRHFFETSKDKFIKGTTFEELYGIFLFDRKLRNIFFKKLLVIENNVKSINSLVWILFKVFSNIISLRNYQISINYEKDKYNTHREEQL